jgi:hypothetical protein
MPVQQSVNVTQVRYFKQTLLMAGISKETLAVGVSEFPRPNITTVLR